MKTADRFEYIHKKWEALCGGSTVGFDMGIYLSSV